MHQHLADNQHAEPIGLLRGAGDEVQLLCTRLKKASSTSFRAMHSSSPPSSASKLMPSASHRLESFAVVTGRLMWIQRLPAMGVNWWQSSGRIKTGRFWRGASALR